MVPCFSVAALLWAAFSPGSVTDRAAVRHSVQVPHYEGTITLGPGQDSLRAELVVRLRERPQSEYRLLLGRTFTVGRVEASGARVRVESTEQPFPGILQAVIIEPTGSDSIVVRLAYRGRLTQSQTPPINSVRPELVELSIDSWWLPFPSDLNAGLTARLEFRGIPPQATVVSTGRVTREAEQVRVELETPNDLALIAAPGLKQVQDGKFIFYALDPENVLARHYRRHGARGLAELEALYGPIPGGGARVVVVPREAAAGYNRPGYFVVSARNTTTSEEALGMGLVHEIAHSWWSRAGFLGEDYWLVEGPAEFTAFRYGLEHFGDSAMTSRLERHRSRAATAGPILGVGRAGSAAVYSKSMMLLRDLERELGREKMDQLLRRMAIEPVHTTAVFLNLLAGIAGRPAADRFEARLRDPGFRENEQ